MVGHGDGTSAAGHVLLRREAVDEEKKKKLLRMLRMAIPNKKLDSKSIIRQIKYLRVLCPQK